MIKFYDPTVALYPIEGVHKQAILVLLSERVAVGGIYSLGSLTLSSTKSVTSYYANKQKYDWKFVVFESDRLL